MHAICKRTKNIVHDMQAWNHYKKINYSRYVIIAAAQRMQMRSMVSRTVLAAFAG